MFDRLEIKGGGFAPTIDLDIVVFVFTNRHLRIKNIGERRQKQIKMLVQVSLTVFGGLDLVLKRAHFGHQFISIFAVFAKLANFTGNRFAACQHFLMFGHQFATLNVNVDQTLCRNFLLSCGHRRVKSLGVVPNPFYVVHRTAPCQSNMCGFIRWGEHKVHPIKSDGWRR